MPSEPQPSNQVTQAPPVSIDKPKHFPPPEGYETNPDYLAARRQAALDPAGSGLYYEQLQRQYHVQNAPQWVLATLAGIRDGVDDWYMDHPNTPLPTIAPPFWTTGKVVAAAIGGSVLLGGIIYLASRPAARRPRREPPLAR